MRRVEAGDIDKGLTDSWAGQEEGDRDGVRARDIRWVDVVRISVMM